MANGHIINLTRPAKVCIDTGRLAIKFTDGTPDAFVSLDDVAMLILGDRNITITQQLIAELAQRGGAAIFVNEKYLPVCMALPYSINKYGAKRPSLQAKYISTGQPGKWQKQIITAKIRGQAKTIGRISRQAENKLLMMSESVLDEDSSHIESIAAHYYWPEYFNALDMPNLIRTKENSTDIINISLNYAYAIIRSAIARSMAAAGLCLSFGTGHCRMDNPFNLVEDFIEPYRYIADNLILDMYLNKAIPDDFSPDIKNSILAGILKTDIELEGKMYRLLQAVDFSVNSFCIALEDTRRKLVLPNQKPSRGKRPSMENNTIYFDEKM